MTGIAEAYIAYAIMLGLVIWFSRDLFLSISSLEAELDSLSYEQSKAAEDE
ncbi:MAG: hypothetical protein ACPHDQ_03370 [Candidatus Thalassarchaeaceae archaeon]